MLAGNVQSYPKIPKLQLSRYQDTGEEFRHGPGQTKKPTLPSNQDQIRPLVFPGPPKGVDLNLRCAQYLKCLPCKIIF